MSVSISEVLHALGITEWFLSGEPKNEAEFNAQFNKVVGTDANDSAILEADKSKWGVTWSQVQAKQTEMDSDWIAQEYARDRKAEYDALNQFELISDDTKNGTTTHIDAIDAIKKKYPKG